MKFWDILKELNGKLSFGRSASAVVLVAWLTWISFLVFSTKTLPAGMWEVGPVIVALYGLNKVAEAITGTKD